ncbi:MAG: pyruvate synthase [Myxococcales bacterium]|nr:pyruvate synthase [Myxococcales bacterium]
MYEIRFHGRGGQGAVTSAELLALSAIADGKSAQAFPSFGPERRGAPVIAFARISESPIRNRTAIQEPNLVIVLDPSLLRLVKVDAGLQPGGTVVINSQKDAATIRKETGISARLVTVDANRIAREEIGRVITNTTMLGAALAAQPLVPVERLEKELKGRFGRIAERNINAFRRAMRECRITDAA